MKRICLCLAIILLLAATVRADVIYIPEDPFYDTHMGQCDEIRLSYLANGPGEAVTVYQSPESSLVKGEIANGLGIHIYYVYTAADGTQWGYLEHYRGTESFHGWVPMVYLVREYDHSVFREEFAGRIVDLDDWQKLEAEGVVRLWSYPGSDYCVEWDAVPEDSIDYSTTFQDDAGRSWAYIAYHYGYRDLWVCLDAPGADYAELYADAPAQAVTLPQAPEHPLVEITPGGPNLGTILAVVGVVAVLSAGFLVVTRKKSK